MIPYTKDLPNPPGSIRTKELPKSGFRHDLPYMKKDIWAPGEIERLFGHDPATYPNQDHLQHYPTVQFNPPVEPTWDSMDNNLNIHSLQRQKAGQTSRPGFVEPPKPLSHNNYLKVGVAESNDAGIRHAVENNLPTQANLEDLRADPNTKAKTSRPGFIEKPHQFRDPKAQQATSIRDSNSAGIQHSLEQGVTVKPGYQEVTAIVNPLTNVTNTNQGV